MAQFINNFFGEKSAAPVAAGDSDFADFAQSTAAAAAEAAGAAVSAASSAVAGSGDASPQVPFTKWYNVHERYSLQDFRAEGVIFVVLAFLLTLHVIGARLNRTKARTWIQAHAALLASEFALVGFSSSVPSVADAAEEAAVLEDLAAKTTAADPKTLLKESSLYEYATYATGRQNVAFVDVKLKLKKRFNPLLTIAEAIVAFVFESLAAPADELEAVLYPFDGKEALTVPSFAGGAAKSAYDGFVWAIVHKDKMKGVRDERFDVSLTFTKDNAKLPAWLTIMSESAEITDALLTPELIEAATAAGDSLDYLIISDQPVDKPTTINETLPRKRVFLKYQLPSNNDYASLKPIFSYFLRSADVLVQAAHLRPEVLRKVKNIREDMVRQIQKASEEEKAEERALEREKARKQKRDTELNALDAKAQKKYLEREREKEMRRSAKRSTVRA